MSSLTIELPSNGKLDPKKLQSQYGLSADVARQIASQFNRTAVIETEPEPEPVPEPRKAGRRPAVTASTDPADILDPTLGLFAAFLDDTESARIAQENRYRQMTRKEADDDGLIRGMGLDESHPDVKKLGDMVEMYRDLEETAIKNLEAVMRRNPLTPWIEAQNGLGRKQTARLLALIGDPTFYWEDGVKVPRSVGQLWQYCGHGAESRKRRGEKIHWNPQAKMRVWNISSSCIKTKGQFRRVYEARRDETAEREHSVPCVRCGPSGKPAQPGTPWSKGHQHADALRIVGKEVLRGLWVEATRIHS